MFDKDRISENLLEYFEHVTEKIQSLRDIADIHINPEIIGLVKQVAKFAADNDIIQRKMEQIRSGIDIPNAAKYIRADGRLDAIDNTLRGFYERCEVIRDNRDGIPADLELEPLILPIQRAYTAWETAFNDAAPAPVRAAPAGAHAAGSQFINIPKIGKRKIRYQKNGKPYVIIKGKKVKL